METNKPDVTSRLDSIDDRVTRIEQAVFGDDKIGLSGMRTDIKMMREDVHQLVAQRDKLRWVLTGVIVSLIVLGGAQVSTLATLARLVATLTGIPTP